MSRQKILMNNKYGPTEWMQLIEKENLRQSEADEENGSIKFAPFYTKENIKNSLFSSFNGYLTPPNCLNIIDCPPSIFEGSNAYDPDVLLEGADGISYEGPVSGLPKLPSDSDLRYIFSNDPSDTLHFPDNVKEIPNKNMVYFPCPESPVRDQLDGLFKWFLTGKNRRPGIRLGDQSGDPLRVLFLFDKIVTECFKSYPKPEGFLSSLVVSLDTGKMFMADICRLRAMRLLFYFVLRSRGVAVSPDQIFIHALTPPTDDGVPFPSGGISSTVAALSALLGGANAVTTRAPGNTDMRGLVAARNVLLLLKEESKIGRSTDPLAGAWLFESQTEQLVDQAWEALLEEQKGNSNQQTYPPWKELLPPPFPFRNDLEKTRNSFDVPIHCKPEDVSECKHMDHIAGRPPYLRGPYPSMYLSRPWTIRQYAGFSTAAESNAFYRKNLEAGQTGLSVAFDLPTHRGYDSDHPRVEGDVGKAGVAIDAVEDMKELFANVPLDTMSVSMTMNGAVIPIMAFYIVAAEESGVPSEKLRGTIQNDILKEFMVRNTYIYPPGPSMRLVADIMKYASEKMPLFNAISVSGYHMHEAGASPEQELAYTLADGMEYLKSGIDAGIPVDKFAPRISFFFGTGMDLFTEVAKLRAARYLWAKIVSGYSPENPKSMALRTHCQTSGWSLTAENIFNNISRTTIEGLAAVLGHTQSLHTNSYDEALALPSEESAAMARETQLFLQNKTDITRTIDPLGGSYHVEHLTHKLITGAWDIISEIQSTGGMTAAVESGLPKRQIEMAAIMRQSDIDQGKDIIIGVNKYRFDDDWSSEILRVNDEEVREQQSEKLRKIKSLRNDRKVQQALEDLKKAAEKDNGEVLAAAIVAAKERATLGEISDALEDVFGRYSVHSGAVTGVYTRSNMENSKYREVVTLTEEFEMLEGRRPRIMVAKLGQDGHDRGARVVASSFADMGFDVDIAPMFLTPEEAARQAVENDVHIVGISSLAGGHNTLITRLMGSLKEAGRGDIMVIAGGIVPEEDKEWLLSKGVSFVFGPGTVLTEAAKRIIEELTDTK